MLGWLLVLLVFASIAIFVLLLFLFIRRCCYRKKPEEPTPRNNSPNGIAILHHVSTLHHHHHLHNQYQGDYNGGNNKTRTNYYVFRRGLSSKPLFNWADNPSLVTDAVENGWSRFAFTTYASSPSVRSAKAALLGACANGDGGRDTAVEISWEVCPGSADFMQKIKLNSGLMKKITSSNSSAMVAASVIKSALPLPGPPLGNSSSFPQEAYFEITILPDHEDGDLMGELKLNRGEGEKIKLIQENPVSNNGKLDELSVGGNENEAKSEGVVLSVGLAGAGSPPLKIPGSYPGSIGFNSNGSVYLDGIKLVLGSSSEEWGRTDKVIGCGYNPSQKKVFFTVDSELVHQIHCKSEEFGTPLYPTLAANTEITVLVNFGQSVFKYAAANLQRTPNPCFIGPLANSPALGYEDSRELFSMGRIDSQWLSRSTTRSTQLYINGSTNKGGVGSDFDEVSEGDLFEIVLDSSGRSPNTPL